MAPDSLKNSPLLRTLSDVLADVADLFQKELQLARAEISAKLAVKLRAGLWFSSAALFGTLAAILLTQALVFWIFTFGISLHLSCLIVAAASATGAAIAFYMGRADAQEELIPGRSVRQLNRDIETTKEHLS